MIKIVVVAAVLVAIVVVVFAWRSSTAAMPSDLGVHDGRLKACPSSPNCVSSQAGDAEHHVEPFPFEGDPALAIDRLAKIVSAEPRTEVVTHTSDYLHVVFRSKLFRFPDDVEFWADSANKRIEVRSASRVGYSDVGVNRARVEKLRAAWLAAQSK